jgi:hypothetical protein
MANGYNTESGIDDALRLLSLNLHFFLYIVKFNGIKS